MIHVQVVGDPHITIGDREIGPSSRTQFSLALYLAIERDSRASRVRLGELLWPNEIAPTRSHSLRQAIYELRQQGLSVKGRELLTLDGEVTVDADSLHNPETTEALDCALRGDVLVGLKGTSEPYEEWLEQTRSLIAAQVRRTLAHHLAAHRQHARVGETERVARVLRRIDPLNEDAAYALAEAMAARGDKAEALALLDSFAADVGHAHVDLTRAIRTLRQRVVKLPSQVPFEAPLVGRDDMMASILERIEALAQARPGGSIAIQGEPGIGKTRLLHEAFRHATLSGVLTLEIAARERWAARPLGVFAPVAERLLALPGALGASPRAIRYLRDLDAIPPDATDDTGTDVSAIHALSEVLSAVTDEISLFITADDAQWMDGSSIAVLNHASMLARTRRVGILVTSRSIGSSAAVACDSVLKLTPLSRKSSLCLIDHFLSGSGSNEAYLDLIVQLTQGNPLHLTTLGRLLRSGLETHLPSTLQALINDRIEALPSTALQVLRTIVVLGQQATWERLEKLLSTEGISPLQPIADLSTAGMLGTRADGLTISHDLIAAGICQSTPEPVLKYLHHRSAALLSAEIDHGSTSAALMWECADHWRRAGERGKAVAFTRRFAKHLLSLGLIKEAVDLLVDAQAHCESVADTVDVLTDLARVSFGSWDHARAAKLLDQIRRLQSMDTEHIHDNVELMRLEAHYYANLTDVPQSLGQLVHCTKNETCGVDHRLHAGSLAMRIADNYLEAGTLDEVYAALEPYLEQANPSRRLWSTQIAQIYHSIRGDLDQGLQLSISAIADARQRGDFLDLRRSLSWLMSTARIAGRFDLVREASEEAIRLATSQGVWRHELNSVVHRALLEYVADDLEQAAKWLCRGRSLIKKHSDSDAAVGLELLTAKLALASDRIDDAYRAWQLEDYRRIPDYPARVRLESRAVEIAIMIQRAENIDDDRAASFFELADSAQTMSRQDYIAFVAYDLRTLRGRGEPCTRLVNYVERLRRDRHPLPESLRQKYRQAAAVQAGSERLEFRPIGAGA